MRINRAFLLSIGLLGCVSIVGCATQPEVTTEAMAGQTVSANGVKESTCQVDEATGSRLVHTTTCADDDTNTGANGAAQSVRGIQNTPNIGPRGG